MRYAFLVLVFSLLANTLAQADEEHLVNSTAATTTTTPSTPHPGAPAPAYTLYDAEGERFQGAVAAEIAYNQDGTCWSGDCVTADNPKKQIPKVLCFQYQSSTQKYAVFGLPNNFPTYELSNPFLRNLANFDQMTPAQGNAGSLVAKYGSTEYQLRRKDYYHFRAIGHNGEFMRCTFHLRNPARNR